MPGSIVHLRIADVYRLLWDHISFPQEWVPFQSFQLDGVDNNFYTSKFQIMEWVANNTIMKVVSSILHADRTVTTTVFDEDIYLIQLSFKKMVTPSSEFAIRVFIHRFPVRLNLSPHKETSRKKGTGKKTWSLQGIVLFLFVNYVP
ncbi:hypothetical protein MAP00_003093 [Monascus purpureus]|nr:hypothetical protein MAP00_003093 [Monascus purpureus]